jgi:hypothetical protein
MKHVNTFCGRNAEVLEVHKEHKLPLCYRGLTNYLTNVLVQICLEHLIVGHLMQKFLVYEVY